MSRPAKTSGECIVCGHLTSDRTQTTGRWHWRCEDGEECAVRRNRRKKRPRPEAEVRARWREIQACKPAAPTPNPYLKTTSKGKGESR